MKTKSMQLTLAVAACISTCNLEAQYAFDRFTIGGGGGTVTIGQ